MITRRSIHERLGGLLAAAAVDAPFAPASPPDPVEARYYEKTGGNRVRCLLCPRECLVGNGERGLCRVRENSGGVLFTLVYAQPCALHLDPIEKKPFFHFFPGTQAVSLSTVGCNLGCKFCQNWQISQSRPEDVETKHTPPAEIVEQADLASRAVRRLYLRRTRHIHRIHAGYREARARKEHQECRRIERLHTEGASPRSLRPRRRDQDRSQGIRRTPTTGISATRRSAPCSIRFSRSVTRGLARARLSRRADAERRPRPASGNMARWIGANLGPDVPLHFSRFYPAVPARESPSHARVDARRRHTKSAARKGSVSCMSETCRGTGGKHVLPELLPEDHRAERIPDRESRYTRNGACRFCGQQIPGIWQEA